MLITKDNIFEEQYDDNNNHTVIIGGLYQHFKGNIYRVIDVSLDCTSKTENRTMVLYCKEKDFNDKGVLKGTIYSREISEFLEILPKDDEHPSYKNYNQERRFNLVPRYFTSKELNLKLTNPELTKIDCKKRIV